MRLRSGSSEVVGGGRRYQCGVSGQVSSQICVI
jgi:hypothetical protein